eukprot:RCo020655
MEDAIKSSDEDVVGQLFMSWIKDTHETPAKENFLRIQEVVAKEVNDKQFVLRSLRLGINCVLTVARLLDRSPVEKIDLYDNLVRDHGVQALVQLIRDSRTLTHLNLGANDIGSMGCAFISALLPQNKKLKVLILGSEDSTLHTNHIDTEAAKGLIEGLSRNKTIKWLDLNRNPIGAASQEPFLAIAKVLDKSKQLSTLKLGSTSMQSASAVAIVKALHNNTGLEFLDFHDNDLIPHVGEAFGELFQARNGTAGTEGSTGGQQRSPESSKSNTNTIHTLLLHGNPKMKAKGLVPLFKTLQQNKSLTTLNVARTSIGNDGCFALAEALKENGTLTNLDLSQNDIEESGAVALAGALQGNTALKILQLSGNRVRDNGAQAFATTLEMNCSLTHLDVSSCWIADAGLIGLGVSLAVNGCLQSLKLGSNHVSDDAGRAFAELVEKNNSLLVISMRGNQVSHSTLLRIKKVVRRNKETKDNEKPGQMQQEVIRLHFQRYKLQEANQELKEHQKARMELQDQADKTEREAVVEKENTAKRSKEIVEKTVLVENFCEELVTKRKQKEEEFLKAQVQYEQDLKAQNAKYKEDTKERELKQKEADDIERQYSQLTQDRDDRLADLQNRVTLAKADTEEWMKKRTQYRQKCTELQDEATKLEAIVREKQNRILAERESKLQEKKAKQKKKGESDALIESLLSGNV